MQREYEMALTDYREPDGYEPRPDCETCGSSGEVYNDGIGGPVYLPCPECGEE